MLAALDAITSIESLTKEPNSIFLHGLYPFRMAHLTNAIRLASYSIVRNTSSNV
jgi:hypothetical protein